MPALLFRMVFVVKRRFLTLLVIGIVALAIYMASFYLSDVDDTPSLQLGVTDVAARFRVRQQVLQEACGNHQHLYRAVLQWKWPSISLPAADSRFSTLSYCPIPKTGSTTLKTLLRNVKSTHFTNTNQSEAASVEGTHPTNVSFVFVREPYARALSAYVDKLFTPNKLYASIRGRYIIEHFRPNASRTSLSCGFDVTFPEYVQFLIHMMKTNVKSDPHYIPLHWICRFCESNYTYIGHLETLHEDMPFILKAIHLPISFTKSYDERTIALDANYALQSSRQQVLSCMSLDEACRRLWRKWQVRGILHKSLPFPLTRAETQNTTAKQLTEVALSALARSGPKEGRVGQKHEALREAFAGIPLEDRLMLKELLFLDFELFGFDSKPEDVFPSRPYQRDLNFSYFDLYP